MSDPDSITPGSIAPTSAAPEAQLPGRPVPRPVPLPLYYRLTTNALRAPLFFLATGVCGTAALVASMFANTGRTQHRIARLWARLCLKAAGARLRVEGAENLRKHPAAVYASNHTSYMDTPVVFAALPFQFRILAKKELWSLPFIGWYLARSGQMPIDTENPRSTLSSLGKAAQALKGGMPLFVFPEGSRTPDGTTQEFLSGAAYLAIRAQAPLVPIALSGVYDLLPIHTRHFYPGEVRLRAGEPIPTEGLTLRDANQLTERLREAIAQLLAR
jgi:1-acyl-sn-glycerol-3-phosphate acyltransferase